MPASSTLINAATVAGIPAALLAHQGGWDEFLLVAGPIAVIAGLLWLARRRTRPDRDIGRQGHRVRD